jgi:hypothetical protein
MIPRITVINAKHSILSSGGELMIPGGYGLQTVYVNMEICFSGFLAGCGHRVRYADGRMLLLGAESIRKMFTTRHQRIHEHFMSATAKIE